MEEAHVTSVRIFKLENQEESQLLNSNEIQGWFMFQVTNRKNVSKFTGEGRFLETENKKSVNFYINSSEISSEVSLRRMINCKISELYLFNTLTCDVLTGELTTKLLSRFSFFTTVPAGAVDPDIIVIVSIDRTITTDDENVTPAFRVAVSTFSSGSDEELYEYDRDEIIVGFGNCLDEIDRYSEVTGLMEVKDLELKLEDCCSICLEEFEIFTKVETPCSHIFHRYCVLQWLHKFPTCPLCRSICVAEV